jgi:hypothetical protein
MWSRLDLWRQNSKNGITREQYFQVCEQMGEEPSPDKIPPELQDFPLDVQLAISVFNKLGDKLVADIGYLGKDYTALPLHIKLNKPDNEEIFVETLLRLDEKLIEESRAEVKRHHEELKRKAKK